MNNQETYDALLREHHDLTRQIRTCGHGPPIAAPGEVDNRQWLSDFRHEVHIRLIEAAARLGRTPPDVLRDLLELNNGSLADLGLAGAVAVSLPIVEDLDWTRDWEKIDFKHVAKREPVGDAESIARWQTIPTVLLIYQTGVGVDCLIPVCEVMPGHDQRLIRCRAAAKATDMRMVSLNLSRFTHGVAIMIGLEVPFDRLETVIGTIRSNPAAYWFNANDVQRERERASQLVVSGICPTCEGKISTDPYPERHDYWYIRKPCFCTNCRRNYEVRDGQLVRTEWNPYCFYGIVGGQDVRSEECNGYGDMTTERWTKNRD